MTLFNNYGSCTSIYLKYNSIVGFFKKIIFEYYEFKSEESPQKDSTFINFDYF